MESDVSHLNFSESIRSLSPQTTHRSELEYQNDPSNYRKFESKNIWDHPSKLAVLITGCDTGFGKLAAQVLPRIGYVCIATCLHTKSVEYFQDLYTQLYESSLSHKKIFSKSLLMDVTNDESIEYAVKETNDYLNSLSISGLYALINNAGIWSCSLLKDSSSSYIQRIEERESFRGIIETNLIGSYNCTLSFMPLLERFTNRVHENNTIYQTLSSIVCPILDTGLFSESSDSDSDESVSETLSPHIPSVKLQSKAHNSTLRCIVNRRRRPRVIFISSVLDSMALPGQAAYCASKYAIKGLHESIRLELYRYGISSVIISPAVIKGTNLFHQLDHVSGIYGEEQYGDLNSMKRNLSFLRHFGVEKESILKILLTALAERVPNTEYRNTPGSMVFKILTNSWNVFKDLAIYIGLYILPPLALFCLDLYHKSTKPFSSAFNFSLDSHNL